MAIRVREERYMISLSSLYSPCSFDIARAYHRCHHPPFAEILEEGGDALMWNVIHSGPKGEPRAPPRGAQRLSVATKSSNPTPYKDRTRA